MKKIPFVDLKAQYLTIRQEIDHAVARVLQSGMYILDREVSAFEQEFAEYCGVGQAIGVASGTDALHLALLACGVGHGDEVITVSFTSVATVAVIEYTGAKPVLVDIDPRTLTIDTDKVLSAITPRTRAVIPVHLFGCPADLAMLQEICCSRGIYLIEDCAQAHGASWMNKKVGAWGNIAAFSFYPTKNLGAYGDGGAVVTNDLALAEKAHSLRQYGWEQRQISYSKGINSRLDELQAAILRVKLKHLDQWNTRRREIAAHYDQWLSGTGITLPSTPVEGYSIFHEYVIRSPYRDNLQSYLDEHGIISLVNYPVPVHLQPAYEELGYKKGDLPASEEASSQVLSLPIYPEMTDEMVEHICQLIRGYEFSTNNSKNLPDSC